MRASRLLYLQYGIPRTLEGPSVWRVCMCEAIYIRAGRTRWSKCVDGEVVFVHHRNSEKVEGGRWASPSWRESARWREVSAELRRLETPDRNQPGIDQQQRELEISISVTDSQCRAICTSVRVITAQALPGAPF